MSERTIVVAPAEAGQTVAAVLHARLAVSWSKARRLVSESRVRLGQEMCLDAARRLKAGQRLRVRAEGPAEPRQSRRRDPPPKKRGTRPAQGAWSRYDGPLPVICHVDEQVVVVDKPAGLTTMRHPDEVAEFGARAKRFLPPTLADLLPELLASERGGRRVQPRPIHRLDRDTTGLVVFALTPAASSHLGRQFRAHSIGRTYVAIVRGRAVDGRIESCLVSERGDGRRGSSKQAAEDGKRAVTHVRVLEELGDFTLVECRLETGRTHQVRIHLGEQGTPLCGERVYDRPLHGSPPPDESGATRPALHAAQLSFDHPTNGKRLSFTAPMPEDLERMLRRMRRGG